MQSSSPNNRRAPPRLHSGSPNLGSVALPHHTPGRILDGILKRRPTQKKSTPVVPLSLDTRRVARQRNQLGQRSRQRGRQRRSPAHRTRGMHPHPGVDACDVEGVAAIRQHAEQVGVLVIAEADRAARLVSLLFPLLFRIHELWIRIQGRLIESRDRLGRSCGRAVLVVHGHMDDGGGVCATDINGAANLRLAMDADADIRGQHDCRYQNQDSYGYGDAVPQPYPAQVNQC